MSHLRCYLERWNVRHLKQVISREQTDATLTQATVQWEQDNAADVQPPQSLS